VNDSRLVTLAAARDSSLPLATAALVQIADDQGRAQFGSLAVAYREEFLWVRSQVRGGSSALSESGSLSVDDARANLRASVLPRLVLTHLIELPND